jgi:Reverse transcriptase (RNA-dependent DNA polymerase)
VATESLFMVAIINAKEKRRVVTVDVEGAYLNAKMDRTVIMEIGRQIAVVLMHSYPTVYDKYEYNGKIYLRLKKALYGTIEAAKLWYQTLSEYLARTGFTANLQDPCVFNKYTKGYQVTITLHVDDLMISCANKLCLEDILQGLQKEYKKINVQEGPKVDYLGMIFDYSEPGAVSISMGSMISELLQAIGICDQDKARTPANTDLFNVDDSSPLLELSDHKKFHSAVALALYVAKRGRPDLLTATSFLSTRVQKSTSEDFKKLKRMGAYLNATKDLKLRLSAEGALKIKAYVDASYGVHIDGKSHTGGTDILGEGSFTSTSTKQKIVTKSSSEAELVGISDRLSPLIANKYFLEYQGYKVGPIKLAQDNNNRCTIVMANKGKPIGKKTRHIAIRHFFIKDRIDSKDVELVNVKTEDMVADYFTKPLQGALFTKMRNIIMGIS